jgi:eukaryotic-like serine/threonine-protein kinase
MAGTINALKILIRNEEKMKKIIRLGIYAIAAQLMLAACQPANPPPVIHNSGDMLWTFQTPGAVWGPPLIYNNTVYIGSDDFNLYALDKKSGEKKWAFQTGSVIRSRPAAAQSPAGELLIFTSDDGYLYGVTVDDGKQLWRTHIGNETERKIRESIGSSTSPLGYDYLQSSPVIDNGRVYIGSADGNVYALQADNGEIVWRYPTEEKVRATPAIADGVVYIGSWDMSMYALDAQTGELRWQTPIGGQVQTTALVHENMVFSASRKASVVALDVETGALVWEFRYGRNMWVESSPVLADTTLFIGSSGSLVVYGLDSKTGTVRLMHVTGAFCWSTPIVRKDTLVIGCASFGGSQNGILAFNIVPHDSNENMLSLTDKWKHPMTDGMDISGNWRGVASSPQYADGGIYFGGLDGIVYAVAE